MKLPVAIFLLLIGMCVAIGGALLTPEPAVRVAVPTEGEQPAASSAEKVVTQSRGHGFEHDTYATMLQGGDGARRYAPIRWAGWMFGVLLILFFGAMITLGARRKDRLGPLTLPLLFACLTYLVSMVAMLLVYQHSLSDSSGVLWASFPKPTAVMLYAVWPAPLVFVATYMLFFDRWIYRPEDAEKFEQLLQQRRAGREEA